MRDGYRYVHVTPTCKSVHERVDCKSTKETGGCRFAHDHQEIRRHVYALGLLEGKRNLARSSGGEARVARAGGSAEQLEWDSLSRSQKKRRKAELAEASWRVGRIL